MELGHGGRVAVVRASSRGLGRAIALEPEAWRRALDTNPLAALKSCRRVLPAMRTARWVRIVLVASLAVKQPLRGLMLSNAARAGLTGFAKSLANEVAAALAFLCSARASFLTGISLAVDGGASRSLLS